MRCEMLKCRDYGLYEIGENPKKCPKCSSPASKIVSFHVLKWTRSRKRKCELCGNIFPTETVYSDPPPGLVDATM